MPRFALTALAALATAAALGLPATAGAASTADVLLHLKHPRGLDAFVTAVSDPRSPAYRDYDTVEQLAARFGASKQARKAAAAYARRHGLRVSGGPTGTYLIASGSRAALRAAFPSPAATRARSGRAWRPAVPAELRGAVAEVAAPPAARASRGPAQPRQSVPLIFPQDFGSARPRTGTPSGCAEGTTVANAGIPPSLSDRFQGYTPAQYLTAYGHATLHQRGLTGRGIRVALVELGGYSPAAIQAFASCFGKRVPPIRVTKVAGISSSADAAEEAMLDLQMLVAGAPDLRGIEIHQGRFDNGGIVRLLASAIGTPGRRPDVISSSLGDCEPLFDRSRAWMDVANEILAVAAGAGISVLDAAGDQGAADCGALPLPSVDFPTSSPYITSVGGTNITLDAANRLVDEVPWNNAPGDPAGGGGGLSLVFKRPWWQRGAVPVTRANDDTRAVPDLAALADPAPGYAINVGQWTTVGGTSAAAPLTAAGIALANQAARRAGQPNVGFLNPLLYRLAGGARGGQVVRDITTGNNDVGPGIALIDGQNLGCCVAAAGYDQASGWGSLKVAAFSDAALAAGRRTGGGSS